jgi:hypothetical protein
MTKPAPGQTYKSIENPDIAFFIEAVHDDDEDGFFTIEACHPSAIGDMTAPGFDLTRDEWAILSEEHALTLSS